MIILGTLIGVIIHSIIIACNYNKEEYVKKAVITTVIFFILLALIEITQTDGMNYFKEYEAMKQSIITNREKGDKIENTALQLAIVEINKKIAVAKYWNNTILDIWINDDFANAEFLE